MRDSPFDRTMRRAVRREQHRELGPDGGRRVDRLKRRSAGTGADALADLAEMEPFTAGGGATITNSSGGLVFMFGVSRLDGPDTLE